MNIRQSIAAALVAAALVIPAQFAVAQDAELLNVNTATVEELAAVPGLNAELAAGIIQYREDMGDIQSLDELTEIPGISRDLLNQLKAFLGIDAIAGAECSC